MPLSLFHGIYAKKEWITKRLITSEACSSKIRIFGQKGGFWTKRGDFRQKGGFRTKGFKMRNLCWFQVINLKNFVKNPKGFSYFSAFYIQHVIIRKMTRKTCFPTELAFQFYKTCTCYCYWLPHESQFAEDPCSFFFSSVGPIHFVYFALKGCLICECRNSVKWRENCTPKLWWKLFIGPLLPLEPKVMKLQRPQTPQIIAWRISEADFALFWPFYHFKWLK